MRITVPVTETAPLGAGIVSLTTLANVTFRVLGTSRTGITALLQLMEAAEQARLVSWLDSHSGCQEFNGEADPADWFSQKVSTAPVFVRKVAPVIEQNVYVMSFTEKKVGRKASVDLKTDALIAAGFTVDGKVFSASDTAQLKWLGMYTSRADLSYPVTVPTKDDTQFVSLIEAADIATYYTALLARVQTVLSGGVTLKAPIAVATDQAALDAIVDDRT